MTAIDETFDLSGERTSALLFVVIAALMTIDLVIDVRNGESLFTNVFELGIFGAALAGISGSSAQLTPPSSDSQSCATSSPSGRVAEASATTRRPKPASTALSDGAAATVSTRPSSSTVT